ncbi:MAG: NfeD family protein [Candidatus Methylomirabilia bacterium]
MRLPHGIWSYVLWQLPGWGVTILFLVLLHALVSLPVWAGVAVFFLVLVKDAVLFPVMKEAFRPSGLGRERLIGARGRALELLAPSGYVQVDGELWRAEVREHGKDLPPGSQVVVRDARGLTLIVEEEQECLP